MAPEKNTPDEFIDFAKRLAEASGEVICEYFRTGMDVTHKDAEQPVTIADKKSEDVMREIIMAGLPDHGIHGEEGDDVNPDADYQWILDPIDGTRAFITGRPIFGTLIALHHKGVPLLGIINQPILEEQWIGATGRPTTFNGAPITTAACDNIEQAIVCMTPYLNHNKSLPAFQELEKRCSFSIYGGDCYSYAQLAMGYQHAVLEHKLAVHDYAALIPIIEGAGGVISDWSGNALDLKNPSPVIASSNAVLHKEILKVLPN